MAEDGDEAENGGLNVNPRIDGLDIIRGLSLLGILFVNAMAFNMPIQVYANPALSPLGMSEPDLRVWWIDETFFSNKFITLFSMLFGISLYLVSRKDDEAATPLRDSIAFRRLSWLLAFGFLHGALIWYGDVLLLYAVTGFVFLRWRRLPAAPLLIWGAALFIFGGLLTLWPSLTASLNSPPTPTLRLPPDNRFAEVILRMQGDFNSSLKGNYDMWAQGIFNEILYYMPITLGLMMLGLGLFKAGVLHGTSRARVYLGLITAGGLCLCLIGWQTDVIITEGFPVPHMRGLYHVANELLAIFVSLGYASVLILMARTPWGSRFLSPLRDAGRMAFSNYLMQSLLMSLIFYGGRAPDSWGLGLFGTLHHSQLVPIVVAIWAFQLIFSGLWMRVFRYGPFEWVWRSLTFQRFMPILR